MDNGFYRTMIEKAPIGYSYRKLLCDENGVPYDYLILEVNRTLEEMTGLTADELIGKTGSQAGAPLNKIPFDWLSFYSKIALEQGKGEAESYSEKSGRYYKLDVYSPEKYYFVTFYTDITREVKERDVFLKAADLPAKILNMPIEDIDFHDMLYLLKELSQAKMALLNMASEDRTKLRTVDAAVDETLLKYAEDYLGFQLIGSEWDYLPKHFSNDNQEAVLFFESFADYTGDADNPAVAMISKGWEFGELVVVKISRGGRVIGEIVLVMPKGVSLEKNELAARMLRQFGLVFYRKETEHALEISEARFRTMFEKAPLGIGLFEIGSGRVREINDKFAEIVGRSREEMKTLDWQSITHPDDMALNIAKRELMLAGKISGFNIIKRYFRPDGSIVWVNLTIVPLQVDENDIPMELCMIEDITERKNREEEIIYLNYHDVLTGLFNRTFLDEEKKRLDVERQLPLSVIMGDINGLKLVNDAFGHAEGDKMLVEISRILMHCCRSEDIVARIGGDEFCILLPKTSSKAASEICRRIAAMCREKKHIAGEESFYPGIALGTATKKTAKQSLENIINEAEDSMYRKKLLERKSIHSSIISSIRTAMFEKSFETEQHAERMVALSSTIGQFLELSDQQMNDLSLLATLHDLGKVSINENILTKQGPLTDDEWQEMKKHPEIGYRIANASVELSSIADYILCHHERWDGTGYPQMLAGEDIPLLSRIIAVVDAYDAMTEDRPYRKAMSAEEAVIEIRRSAGSQFDPYIAEIFVSGIIAADPRNTIEKDK